METNKFKAPLIQSAVVMVVVVILFLTVSSSGADSVGGSIFAIFAGIGKTILFFIGMALSLLISIGILVGIFLAAVGMYAPEQAAQMYADLKKNFSLNALTCKGDSSCQVLEEGHISISEVEYARMKQELEILQTSNKKLKETMQQLVADNSSFGSSLTAVNDKNAELTAKIEDLGAMVQALQQAEQQLKEHIASLREKLDAGDDQEIKSKLAALSELHDSTRKDIAELAERLDALELTSQQSPVSGIFSYISDQEQQVLFAEKIKEALEQEMTYAQIDAFLSEQLPADLDKIIKDHPALTKNYIRNLRRE